jgi:superfamily I DNA and/or RNA helicase
VLKLLSKLSESGRKHKILLCAPSNNACDELSRRILDEVENQDVPFKSGEYLLLKTDVLILIKMHLI